MGLEIHFNQSLILCQFNAKIYRSIVCQGSQKLQDSVSNFQMACLKSQNIATT